MGENEKNSVKNDHVKIYEYSTKTSIIGYHPKTEINDDKMSPTKKIKLAPTMRPDISNKDFSDCFKESWNKNMVLKRNDMEMLQDPFKLCIFNNFIESSEFINSIMQDFNEIEWSNRNMDLYEFFQSKDLKFIDAPYIKAFYDFMKNTVMKWASDLTGYEFVDLSATCSCYTNTDYLLVHDDQQDTRLVAFVYYLTGPTTWDSSKGGSLDLLSKDERGLPLKVTKSILPRNNQLVFFPVTNDSYHQVAEVTTLEDSRLTINGWFHSRTAPVFKIPHFEYSENSLFGREKINPQLSEVPLNFWINEDYLNNEDGTLDDIQKHIEENSEISLNNFFIEAEWKEVSHSLELLGDDEEKWCLAAPPNRSCYRVLSTTNMPPKLKSFSEIFQSENFFAYLKAITDLDLISLRFEFQMWTPGSYSLLSDHNWNSVHELDVIVFFPLGCENDIIGGRIQYVNPEEEIQEALITIDPSENTLNVVYRDTARFTKYYSKQSKCKKFYLLICSYSE